MPGPQRVHAVDAIAACEICQGTEFIHHLRVDHARFTERITKFDIQRCATCGFCRMTPPPNEDDLQKLYEEKNIFSAMRENPYQNSPLFGRLEPIYRKHGDGRRFIIQNCLKLAPGRRKTKLRVLDIGCGTGALLDAFQQVLPDCDIVGIDIDTGAKANAPDHLRDRIQVGDVLTTSFKAPFDIITLEMVIEHLPDPAKFLHRCHELLLPDGIVMISTPDIDSKPARDSGADWWLINRPDVPVGHRCWFNMNSITCLADGTGFKPARIRKRGSLFPYFPKWLQKTIQTLLGNDSRSGRLIRWYPVRILWALIIDGWLSEFLNRGEYIYAFLIKTGAER